MANNEERFCNICNRETLFTLGSDMLWYCDECDNVFESNHTMCEEDIDELLLEFEEENGESVLCKSCNNFVVVESVLEEGICYICQNDLDDELTEKGYIYNEEEGTYYKD